VEHYAVKTDRAETK